MADLQDGSYYWHDEPTNPKVLTNPSQGLQGGHVFFRNDPRTDRFGCNLYTDTIALGGLFSDASANAPTQPGARYGQYAKVHYASSIATSPIGWVSYVGAATTGTTLSFPGMLYYNDAYAPNINGVEYYADSDGVVRRASGAYTTVDKNYDSTPMTAPYLSPPTADTTEGKPIILNRPFRSVAELGYAFRDLPWKNIDFFTAESGDAALLDVFTAYGGDVTAGHVDLNTRNQPVLLALLNGAMLKDSLNSWDQLAPSDVSMIANTLIGMSGTTPFVNRSELVTRLLGSISSASNPPPNLIFAPAAAGRPNNNINKGRMEVAIRALAETANTRTWNLMIDVIAQTGQYPATAAALNNFIVEGERRYWLHIAIDRYTGAMIDSYLEPVYE
jgi:hypothetical protein